MSTKIVTLMLVWLLLCLQVMLFLHEVGHLIAAKLMFVQITYLDLFPLRINSLLFDAGGSNQWLKSNLIVASGFVLGSLLPMLSFPFWRIQSGFVGIFLKSLSSFCVLANGLYLMLGSIELLGSSANWTPNFTDSGLLISSGCPAWILIIAGGTVAGAGYWLLSRLARQYWKAEQLSRISWKSVAAWSLTLAALLALQFVFALVVNHS